MNPNKKEDFELLVASVKESHRKIAPFRDKRKELIKLFCGSEYGDNEGVKKLKVYLNLLSLAVSIYVRQCAVRAPIAKITTSFNDLRPLAANLTLACKEAAEECKLGQILRRAVTEALFAPLAVVKIGLEYAGKQDYMGEEVDLTKPFVKMVSFDDYVRDMSARSAYAPAYEGDRYAITTDDFKKIYKEAELKPENLGMNDEEGNERAESIAHSPLSGGEEYPNKIILQDIWLPRERTLVTYREKHPGERPLRVIKDFDTSEEGPYRSLWFTDVPDNGMPLPVFGGLRHLHELSNSLFRRMAYQAKNKKRVVGFSDKDSAHRFKKAHDGDGVWWDSAKPEQIEAGGIDPTIEALFIQVKDVFSWAAGNLDSLGGLSPMSETARQDEMLARSASAQIADMQDATSQFAKSIFKQIAWYEQTDPVRNRILQKRIPGTEIDIPIKWSPKTREGDYLKLNFDINPISMREESPAATISKLTNIVMNVLLPLSPMLERQGMTIDIRKLNTLIADYSNLSELEDIIIAMDPSQQTPEAKPAGNPNPLGKPANTKRTYERVNRPGATRVGKDMALMSSLMNTKVQPDEAASVGRPVS